MNFTRISIAAITATALLLGACTSDAALICDRRKECVSSGLDVDACVDDVERYADDSAGNAGDVEDCAACIDGRSCSAAIGNCVDDCFGVPGW